MFIHRISYSNNEGIRRSLQSLEYADKPDYGMLAGLFERCMKRRGVKPNDPYDWERPLIANEGLSTTRSLPTVAVAPPLTTATTINQPPTTNVDTNNQENVEPDNRKELDVRVVRETLRVVFGVVSWKTSFIIPWVDFQMFI